MRLESEQNNVGKQPSLGMYQEGSVELVHEHSISRNHHHHNPHRHSHSWIVHSIVRCNSAKLLQKYKNRVTAGKPTRSERSGLTLPVAAPCGSGRYKNSHEASKWVQCYSFIYLYYNKNLFYFSH